MSSSEIMEMEEDEYATKNEKEGDQTLEKQSNSEEIVRPEEFNSLAEDIDLCQDQFPVEEGPSQTEKSKEEIEKQGNEVVNAENDDKKNTEFTFANKNNENFLFYFGINEITHWINTCGLNAESEKACRILRAYQKCFRNANCLENIKDFITKEVISAEASDASSYEDPQALQVLIQDLKSEDTNTVMERIGMLLMLQLQQKSNTDVVTKTDQMRELSASPNCGYNNANITSTSTIISQQLENENTNALVQKVAVAEPEEMDITVQLESPFTVAEMPNTEITNNDEIVISEFSDFGEPNDYANLEDAHVPDRVVVTDAVNRSAVSPKVEEQVALLQEKLGPDWLGETYNVMSKAVARTGCRSIKKQKIIDTGKFLFKHLFTQKEILQGNTSGKRSIKNPRGLKYDEQKVDIMSGLISWLLQLKTGNDLTVENFQKYLMQPGSVGLSKENWNTFSSAVLVTYANCLRLRSKHKLIKTS